MPAVTPIPIYQLFGETTGFPDLAHCEHIRDRAPVHDWSIAPHRHDRMVQALYLVDGTAQFQIDGREFALCPGEFVFVPLRAVHSFTFSQGAEGLVMSFPLPLVAPLIAADPRMAQALAGHFLAEAPPALQEHMTAFSRCLATPGRFRDLAVIAAAQTVLCSIAEIGAGQGVGARDRHQLIDRFEDLLSRHLAEGWPVERYAAELGVSSGHLSRLCRQTAGNGARDYIDRAVATEACRLLAFTRLPVSEIGYRLGFDDPSHFSRRFRSLIGVTPSDYRNRVADGD